jgi:5-hydroxyisourate hydrolase
MADGISRISTHILDTALGIPAAGVPVRLERRSAHNGWVAFGSSRTDGDGRCKQLLPEPHALPEGTYRLVFDTASYFAARQVSGFYPVVEISFEVRSGETHFHIPLLLSPNGYTTYRGS